MMRLDELLGFPGYRLRARTRGALAGWDSWCQTGWERKRLKIVRGV